MTFPTQLSETPATGNATRANEAFDTLNGFATYLKRHAATNGLTWAYWGDRWGPFSVAEGTLTLTDDADNYVVVLRSTGVISVSTSSTNWDDTTNYARVYKITTAGGVPTVVEPHYSGPGGVHGSAAAAGSGTEMRGLTYTADTGSTADSDPGAGLFKWNNATQGSATVLYIDEATADAVNVDASMAALAAGTLHIQQATDAARWQRWSYSAAPVDGAGYWKLTVTLLEKTSGDIQDGALCYLDFDDEGAPGASGIGGSTGAVDNALLRANGTGGATAQASGVIVSDADEISGYLANRNLQTGTTYTLDVAGTDTDSGKVIDHANAAAIAVTLPNSAPAGFVCTYVQAGAGQITFAVQGGGTAVLRNRQSHTKTAGQWAMVTLYVRGNSGGTAAEWVLGGDTAA